MDRKLSFSFLFSFSLSSFGFNLLVMTQGPFNIENKHLCVVIDVCYMSHYMAYLTSGCHCCSMSRKSFNDNDVRVTEELLMPWFK